MPRKTPYHVYSRSGFESAHTSLTAANRAAKSAAKKWRQRMEVVEVGPSGYTGPSEGTTVSVWRPGGVKVAADNPAWARIFG